MNNPLSLGNVFYRFGSNLKQIYTPKNLAWQLLGVAATLISVFSGFDWIYFRTFRNTIIYPISFSAAIIGMALPILGPIILYIIGRIRKSFLLVNISLALGQAVIFGWLISSFYKSFTGRAYPPQNLSNVLSNISHQFRFTFFHSGIFWGWPSSHTTVAFAMSVALINLFPKNSTVRIWSWIYAFYIGLMVAVSIHWFSDFLAGAIIGTIIGYTVGTSFRKRVKLV